jgi:hypothetical protein
MLGNRGSLEVEDLLKVILVLVIVWIIISIVGQLIDGLAALLGPLQPLLGLVVLALIVLWLLDRI